MSCFFVSTFQLSLILLQLSLSVKHNFKLSLNFY
uniref:Uncharacterized protein n=1 Tax=Siphoviridae sp. ctEJG5 TaxID=2827814 RepID=A0A8S5RXQ0_9CAUD|nr:MAG TPA: hypothetical protein [Siphoviridae sp. ctEJG5]